MPSPDGTEPSAPDHQVELVVDLGAFLPEGTAIGPVEGPPHAVGAESEEPATPPPVDLAVLAGIEADLAAVDQAIAAIDAGDPSRSPLLTELLGPPTS